MGVKKCGCKCEDLLGIGTEFAINIGDEIRVFTAGGVGPEPFQGTLIAIEPNTIVLDTPGEASEFVRFCCAHITSIELVSRGPA